MRVVSAAVVLAAVAFAGAASAATAAEPFIGNTVRLKFSDGAAGAFYGNADGTYAQVTESKGRMVGANGTWRKVDSKLCLKWDGHTKEVCWVYPALSFGQTVVGRSDNGDTVQITLIKGY
jgi:opacity protein-like surface antigen